MIYNYFISTFFTSSLFCFLYEMIDPTVRVNLISRDQIVKNYFKMIPHVSLNVLSAYPCISMVEKHITFDPLIFSYDSTYVNTLLWTICFMYYFITWYILTDIAFYSIHYMLHRRRFYWLHARHHSFRYTHGIGAVYSSLFEFIVGNVGTIGLPIYILSIPKDYTNIIIIFATSYTIIVSHSGFKIFNKSHLKHHLKYKVNYGIGILDKIFETKD